MVQEDKANKVSRLMGLKVEGWCEQASPWGAASRKSLRMPHLPVHPSPSLARNPGLGPAPPLPHLPPGPAHRRPWPAYSTKDALYFLPTRQGLTHFIPPLAQVLHIGVPGRSYGTRDALSFLPWA